MFENRQIAVIEAKCRQFRNSSEYLKTRHALNNWRIWTQKVQKEALRLGLQTSKRAFFKNIFLCMNGHLLKIRSVHTYFMPRTVYFGWICTATMLKKRFFKNLRDGVINISVKYDAVKNVWQVRSWTFLSSFLWSTTWRKYP